MNPTNSGANLSRTLSWQANDGTLASNIVTSTVAVVGVTEAPVIGGAGNTVAQNAYNISAERGLSSFDQRHSLNFNYNFTAPKSKHAILSDWQLTGGITATSGTPFTARVLGNQSNIGGSG